MLKGCYTALITPFKNGGVDIEGLEKLSDFQIQNGVDGILAVGTTGESPTLSWKEHNIVIEKIAGKCKNRCICIAGTGSNNTNEAIEATKHACTLGVDAVLLVDPYYNGPSSLEIRKEYIEPVAKAFPEIEIIPYIIPGRTGAKLFPEDMGILNKNFKNINTVKEATGDIESMIKTRDCCGQNFSIFSGDDGFTYEMMSKESISGCGVISVVSNIAPKAVSDLVSLLGQKKFLEAKKLDDALAPLYDIVTVNTKETSSFGDVLCRARNPLGIKTLMAILEMPSGKCRSPLGKMTRKGVEKILKIAKKVQDKNPEIFKPVEDFFNVDVTANLNNPEKIENLYYMSYE